MKTPQANSTRLDSLGFIWGWSCQFALNSYHVGQALRMFANHDFYRTICTNQIQNWLKPNVENHPLSGFKILCPHGRVGSSPTSGTTVFCDVFLQNTAFSIGSHKPQFSAWGQIWGQHRVCIDFVSLVLFTLYEKNQSWLHSKHATVISELSSAWKARNSRKLSTQKTLKRPT